MGMSTSVTTGYGFAIPEDYELPDDLGDDLWDYLETQLPSELTFDTGGFEYEGQYVVLVERTSKNVYGYGVFSTLPLINDMTSNEGSALVGAAFALGLGLPEMGWLTVISYG